jgi:septal ring factor EnvC (AmiA/AmiB activator)
MAMALKKLIEKAKEVYQRMENDRWGTSWKLLRSKLYVFDQLLTHPITNQAIIDLIDLDIEKGIKAELEVMKMTITHHTIEYVLKIIKNSVLVNIGKLSIDDAKADNVTYLTAIDSYLKKYDTQGEFVTEIEAAFAEAAANKAFAVSTFVVPDTSENKIVPHKIQDVAADFADANTDIENLKKLLNDFAALTESLKYSHEKKAKEMAALLAQLNESVDRMHRLESNLSAANNEVTQKSEEISILQESVKHLKGLRTQQLEKEAELRLEIEKLENTIEQTQVKTQADFVKMRLQFEKLQSDYRATETNYQDQITQLTAEITSLTTINQAIIALGKTTKAELYDKDETISQLQQRHQQSTSAMMAANTRLSMQITELQTQLISKDEAFDALMSDYKKTKDQLRDAQRAQVITTATPAPAPKKSYDRYRQFKPVDTAAPSSPSSTVDGKNSDTTHTQPRRLGIKTQS